MIQSILFITLIAISFWGCAKEPNPLQTRCGGNICCLKSLEIIDNKGYILAADNLCPEGKTLNGLNCPGSYKWCE